MTVMENFILQELANLEEERQIKILFACESGNRAWGFASPDSDYDVRFIYAHPLHAYLSIQDKKDMIEDLTHSAQGEVVDLIGWDIKKALSLFSKSNVSLFEWIQSPIIYTQEAKFLQRLKQLIKQYFNIRQTVSHYLSIARSTLQHDLKDSQPKIKKYFYALRPLLAAIWIAEKQTLPPIIFQDLLTLIDKPAVLAQINALIQQKKYAEEDETTPQIQVLNQFIEYNITNYEALVPSLVKQEAQIEPLNELFRQTIQTYTTE